MLQRAINAFQPGPSILAALPGDRFAAWRAPHKRHAAGGSGEICRRARAAVARTLHRQEVYAAKERRRG